MRLSKHSKSEDIYEMVPCLEIKNNLQIEEKQLTINMIIITKKRELRQFTLFDFSQKKNNILPEH